MRPTKGVASPQLLAIIAITLVLGAGIVVVRSQTKTAMTTQATTSPSPTPTPILTAQTPSPITRPTTASTSSPNPTSTTRKSGICGTVMYLPNTIAASQGETAQGIAKEMIALDSNHKIVARVTSNSDGTFFMALPAGTYTLETAEDGDYGRKQPVTVHGEACTAATYTISPP